MCRSRSDACAYVRLKNRWVPTRRERVNRVSIAGKPTRAMSATDGKHPLGAILDKRESRRLDGGASSRLGHCTPHATRSARSAYAHVQDGVVHDRRRERLGVGDRAADRREGAPRRRVARPRGIARQRHRRRRAPRRGRRGGDRPPGGAHRQLRQLHVQLIAGAFEEEEDASERERTRASLLATHEHAHPTRPSRTRTRFSVVALRPLTDEPLNPRKPPFMTHSTSATSGATTSW